MSVTDARPAVPAKAMVLAAGLGTRMRPITEHTPKCLVSVGGRTLLDRALDRVAEAGVPAAVVNVHHFADQVRAHLEGRTQPAITLSDESGELLETGGGIVKALPLLGDDPFFVLNSDCIVLNGVRPALLNLVDAWDAGRMDALLLLARSVTAHGYDGLGDFFMDIEGRIRRREENEVAPYIYSGVMLVHPRLFDGAPAGAFSLNVLFNRAIESGRLFGLSHDGEWYHVGTPQAIEDTERQLLLGEDSTASDQ
ncbi:nucleotidyltransferase family protein [Caenispirillum salinarum]|uniref:nucleotidyltransferase family protein n=1 Tax=Caenispirillum salinarum TaxID=859058 RepID=UPI00384E8D17